MKFNRISSYLLEHPRPSITPSRDQEASRQFSSCRYQSSHSHLTTDPYLWFGQSYDPYAPTSTGVSSQSCSLVPRQAQSSTMSERTSFSESSQGYDVAGVGMMEAVAHELKMESHSPGAGTSSRGFSFSRTSSTGSVHQISCSSASSAHNTDDEDSDGTTKTTISYKDRRREAHTQAEQKRRDAIKRGYEDLQNVVPMCQQPDSLGSQKLSKAAILQKSIDYIQYLVQQKKKQEEELEGLRKEVMALKIMKANYEHIVKAHQNTPHQGQHQVSDEVKFQVFQQVMDALFQSFNASISVANFAELSGCVFSWLEEYCKPQTLRELTLGILRQLNSQLHH